MEYISAEEFLKQPKEIQESLLHWWKPNEFDVYKEISTGYVYVVDKKQTDQETWERLKNTKTIIPLFTEGQLRKFIEDKTGYRVCLIPYCDDEAIPHYLIKFKSNYKVEDKQYCIWENDVIKAYWQVAFNIAEEIINEER